MKKKLVLQIIYFYVMNKEYEGHRCCKSANRVQILGEAFYDSLRANTRGKGINISVDSHLRKNSRVTWFL